MDKPKSATSFVAFKVKGPVTSQSSLSGVFVALPFILSSVAETVNDEGVWKIEFIPTGNKVDTNSPTASDVFADGTWSQSNNTPLISAWDVSVCNAVKDKWLRGRVYTNVLNLKLSQNFDDSNKAYNGINYVLTKDGRAYRVKNNGNNGLGFTFFSNNKGFVDATGNPLYKSLNTTDETVIANAVHT